ncbi:cupredoxin domain-containing protein [Aquabacterium sp. OR-4]|uniref:cupredoxin domain-containing protein n=1 Tax=Aquabacterium sp. OR-4 TaxID=2978127 RepID=UPI0028C91789|nr:plastocyanin [Aquabacterium sp. OR-4]MDT7836804.1 plastocyanin [Aquabacterium sp. OR-4]
MMPSALPPCAPRTHGYAPRTHGLARRTLGRATARSLLAITLLGGQAALNAQAGQLQVSVLDADGKPAPDVVVSAQPTGIWPSQPLPEPALIVQQGSKFLPYVTAVPVGATVRFVNRDRYDHHVRSQPGGPLGSIAPAQQFEFRLGALRGGKEATQDLKAETAGVVTLGCHLHGAMRGHLVISSTPWVAVSNERGEVTLPNLPDGPVQLRVWHPDQLVEQPVMRVQAAGQASAEARLNFAPKPRRSPPTPPRDYNTTY